MTQSDLRRYFLAFCVSAWIGWPALPWAELRLAIEDFAEAIEKGEKTEANSINRAASYMEPKQIENVIADHFDPQVGSEISSSKSSLETPLEE
jgi:hypothetical protein